MSFEGYYQLICKNGHYYSGAVYGMEEKTICHCGEGAVWWNLVDTTNDEGNPIELERIFTKKCDKCGTVLETKYKVPKNGGHKVHD